MAIEFIAGRRFSCSVLFTRKNSFNGEETRKIMIDILADTLIGAHRICEEVIRVTFVKNNASILGFDIVEITQREVVYYLK